MTFSIDTDSLLAVLCSIVRSNVPVPETVRNSVCSGGSMTGAMALCVKIGASPNSIVGLVHAFKSGTDKLYAP